MRNSGGSIVAVGGVLLFLLAMWKAGLTLSWAPSGELHRISKTTTAPQQVQEVRKNQTPSPPAPPPASKTWHEVALRSGTDKTGSGGHSYQLMYDRYFTAEVQQQPVKLLEIGLGCDMRYGPGASAKLWAELLPLADIWFGEYNEPCAKKFMTPGVRWKVVTGNQENPKVLARWVEETGGQFDFIVDDGGHTNAQIWQSFQTLFFKALKPGGVYFIEDLQVAKHPTWFVGGVDHKNGVTMPDIISEWVVQLTLGPHILNTGLLGNRTFKYPLPPEVERIECFPEACVVGKRKK